MNYFCLNNIYKKNNWFFFSLIKKSYKYSSLFSFTILEIIKFRSFILNISPIKPFSVFLDWFLYNFLQYVNIWFLKTFSKYCKARKLKAFTYFNAFYSHTIFYLLSICFKILNFSKQKRTIFFTKIYILGVSIIIFFTISKN